MLLSHLSCNKMHLGLPIKQWKRFTANPQQQQMYVVKNQQSQSQKPTATSEHVNIPGGPCHQAAFLISLGLYAFLLKPHQCFCYEYCEPLSDYHDCMMLFSALLVVFTKFSPNIGKQVWLHIYFFLSEMGFSNFRHSIVRMQYMCGMYTILLMHNC